MKEPRTTGEHIVSLYGHLKGVKKDIYTIKNNHLKHMHEDIDKIHGKVSTITYLIIGGLGSLIITLITLFGDLLK